MSEFGNKEVRRSLETLTKGTLVWWQSESLVRLGAREEVGPLLHPLSSYSKLFPCPQGSPLPTPPLALWNSFHLTVNGQNRSHRLEFPPASAKLAHLLDSQPLPCFPQASGDWGSLLLQGAASACVHTPILSHLH